MLERRGHVHDVDAGSAHERFDALVHAPAEFGREARRRLGAGVAGRDQTDARIGRERRHHQREGATEADHADAELPRPAVCPATIDIAHGNEYLCLEI